MLYSPSSEKLWVWSIHLLVFAAGKKEDIVTVKVEWFLFNFLIWMNLAGQHSLLGQIQVRQLMKKVEQVNGFPIASTSSRSPQCRGSQWHPAGNGVQTRLGEGIARISQKDNPWYIFVRFVCCVKIFINTDIERYQNIHWSASVFKKWFEINNFKRICNALNFCSLWETLYRNCQPSVVVSVLIVRIVWAVCTVIFGPLIQI